MQRLVHSIVSTRVFSEWHENHYSLYFPSRMVENLVHSGSKSVPWFSNSPLKGNMTTILNPSYVPDKVLSQCLGEKISTTKWCLPREVCVESRDTFTKKGMKIDFWASHLQVPNLHSEPSAVVSWSCFYKVCEVRHFNLSQDHHFFPTQSVLCLTSPLG